MNCKKIITAQIAFMVGSMNGFERDFTIELKSSEGLMEDWLKYQISLSLNIVKTKPKHMMKIHVCCLV